MSDDVGARCAVPVIFVRSLFYFIFWFGGPTISRHVRFSRLLLSHGAMPRSLEGSIILCVVLSVLGYTFVFASKTVKCKIPTYKSASKKGDGR